MPSDAPLVEIKVRDDGPYKVTGPVRIVDPDGGEFALPPGESVVLCRCGHSRTKPFCDRSHREAGFRSRERADAATSP
ncbi:MAG TPA: CDGSH iron-sulfur domain-containing protein [Solirubrobacteraceae bacterium]|jgi:CDGSH-type Zn-finger protein|nr:CDGSH iron-sulfur domain-containing protein [Solirubrobacteraceae bacterium]